MDSNFGKLNHRIEIRPYELGESISGFDCGKQWFNNFINTEQVANYRRNRLGRTKLVYFDGEFAAFFCLSPSSMESSDYDEQKTRHADELYDGPFDMPARLLGHLAVDLEFEGRGLGEYLVNHILADTIESDTPFRVVILHSHDDVTEFYQKYGFVKASPNSERGADTTLMFYDIGKLPE